MFRLNRHTLLLLACCCYTFSFARTNNCTAAFNYSAGNNNAVTFFAYDSLQVSHHWIFGDGSPAIISTQGAITHQYSKPGQYEVKHIVENRNTNCRDSIVKTITVPWLDQCNASWYFSKDSANLSIRFHNTSTTFTGIKTLRWNFGDGAIADSQDPVHTYAKAGVYTVCLNIETNSGCKSEYCTSIQLIDSVGDCALAPKYYYYKQPDSCQTIQFYNTSSPVNNGVHFTWNFGDGNSSHDLNPAHHYSKPGKYYVCLVAEAAPGCRKVYCDSVMAYCDPCSTPLSYTYSIDSLNCKKINFKTQSFNSFSKTDFVWNFGDGIVSHDVNPSHTYNHNGIYRVCLVSETGSSCRREFCDSVIIRCADSCTIQPAYRWRQDGTSNKIIFTNLTTGLNATVGYAWKFGDNTTSNDVNPAHVYANPGIYTVCLVAESGNNCRKEICQQVEIKACNVLARFEPKHDSAQWNKVWFANVSSPVNAIWQTNWSYGDGGSSQDYNSFHVYDKAGVYNVCLKVTSLNGCSSSYCDTVTIVKKDSCVAKANFSHYSSSASSASVKFEALYQSNTAQYSWSFGDSTAGVGRIAYHNYAKAGKYNVCLTIKDGQCLVSYCETITIEKSADGNRIAVSPNPAVNTVSIDVNLDRPGQLSIRFMDGSGGIRSTFSRNGVSGNNRFSLPISSLSHGLYLVEIKSNSGTWFSRFVKG